MAGGFFDYLENKILDLAFGATNTARPATLYLNPYTTNPNDAGASGVDPTHGYSARLAVTNNTTNFPNASGGVKSLATIQTLYTANGVDVLTGVGIWDASSSGNGYALFVPSGSLTTANAKRVKIPANTLTLTLTGAWAAAFANVLLDHFFGGADYTPEATWYYALAASGTELSGNGYARVAVTNNTTNFPNASGGSKTNGADVVFGPASGGNWSAADQVQFYSASSGGTAKFTASLGSSVTVLNGETATFDAGSLALSAA